MRIFLTYLVLVLAIPASVQAQERLRCESDGNGFRFCRAGIQRGDQVQLTRRLSKASCDRGRSWGLERGGIWVDRGCRAEFTLSRSYRSDSYGRGAQYNGGAQYGSGSQYSGAPYQNRYNSGRRDYDNRYYRGDDRYQNRRPGKYRDNRWEVENRRERRRLANERRKLEQERRALQKRKKQIDHRGGCPSGARVGRCSKEERARGCKDWKTENRTPCKSFG